MEKQKRWHLVLIITVILLTVYNILPTLFYYSKPLNEEVGEARAYKIAADIGVRVNKLEDESIDWLYAFCKLLKVQPASVKPSENYSRWIDVKFNNEQDSKLFQTLLPQAGSLITFVPAQLELASQTSSDPLSVTVERRIGTKFTSENTKDLFAFATTNESHGGITPLYREVICDRVTELLLALTGPSETAQQLNIILENPNSSRYDELVLNLADQVNQIHRTFGDSQISKRFYSIFTRNNQSKNPSTLIQGFISRIESQKIRLEAEKNKSSTPSKENQSEATTNLVQNNQDAFTKKQIEILELASQLLRKNSTNFSSGPEVLTRKIIQDKLLANSDFTSKLATAEKIDINGYHPFIQELVIDWNNDSLSLSLYKDIDAILSSDNQSEEAAYKKDKTHKLLINEIADLSRRSGETINPEGNNFAFKFNKLTNSKSFLSLNLDRLAEYEAFQIESLLNKSWLPSHTDLQRNNYPILAYSKYQELPALQQKFGLVVYAPSNDEGSIPEGFDPGSIYIIAKSLNPIIKKFEAYPESDEANAISSDLNSLQEILTKAGFVSYLGSAYGVDKGFKDDIIFKMGNFYNTLLKATREDFSVHGSKRFAILDFTNVEQRILTENKIDDAQHEELLQWKENYNSAQVKTSTQSHYTVPAPTQNTYLANIKLSARKYFRGDERKILKWGLDLSGGKSVRIGLRDQNNQVVTNPEDLNQAVNELYTRINKMGVSERVIRIENSNIILDFPGSQGLSASELVKASAMYFHIVNEKFTVRSPNIGSAVNSFLQDVWNEAVVTNRKDIESLNIIAWNQLGGQGETLQVRSTAAQQLIDAGLNIAHPDRPKSNAFDDTLSTIGRMRGEDYTQWQGQSHPLTILFNNYTLEGSNLTNVQVGFDTREGNYLVFSVSNSYGRQRPGSPREDFYRWTSAFAEDRIQGTLKEQYTQGIGWRLAIVLNNEIVSSPKLSAALKDGGTISGQFTQREISTLAADLKAGSLSFTPKILSESNISPELGSAERQRGFVAAAIGFVLVIALMTTYYRFAGVIASIAVVFNLLIMWGVLQNIDAALSLPGIAAIVLTVGMAVDANVLVFERTREEFKISGRIASALQAGYRKAFTAIIDSNITTIIAALILIQFDSGPIKGFATTLIIGIISSMFTALFMTRYYFASWVRNPKNTSLTMMEFINNSKFNFLKYAKPAIIASIIFIIAGGFFLVKEKNVIFGMDFTGGYSFIADLDEKADTNYRQKAINALLGQGLSTTDFQIQELSRPNQLKIQLGMSMEEPGHPFFKMADELKLPNAQYAFEINPRLTWIVDALKTENLTIQPWQLDNLDTNWTVMSGQLSDAMRNNALIALSCALIAILIYITLRFEFKYAISAVIGLIHDVLITIGALAILRWSGLPIEIDLQAIGAIMTIIGYSLNDTIIIFDRIREDIRLMRKSSFEEIINHALNVTLSRTIMTSATTLLVLVALVFFGGHSIFTFSLLMTIGVLVGTFSSLFICSPVLLFVHNREEEREGKSSSLKLKHG